MCSNHTAPIMKYLRVSDIFKNPRKTTIAEDVRKQTQEDKKNKPSLSSYEEQQRAWSELGSKVFGEEGGY